MLGCAQILAKVKILGRSGNVLQPLTTDLALGATESGISVAPVVTIHQNQRSQGS